MRPTSLEILAPMPRIDLIDETYLAADPAEVADRIHNPALWRSWWPRLELAVFMDRGLAGLRWTVTGELVGTSEVWLEPMADGVLLHYFLRAEPTRPGSDTEALSGRPRRVARVSKRAALSYSTSVKRSVWALKDNLETGRAPGLPRERPGSLPLSDGSARA